jgi:hypothetical protein
MVLVHQKEVENRIVLASSKGDAAAKETGEALVKAMLFAGAVPLTAPVKGTSNFAAEFAAQGPRDSRGRSLRDFDLQTRLFRYPLSYLIYGKSFNALPAGVKTYVYRRLREILSGEDKSKDFCVPQRRGPHLHPRNSSGNKTGFPALIPGSACGFISA